MNQKQVSAFGRPFILSNVTELLAPNYDIALSNILSHTSFERVKDDVKRNTYMTTLPSHHMCEWANDFIHDPNTYFLLHKDIAVAAVIFNDIPDFVFNGIPYYHVDIECSWAKSHDIFHTWGRILWAYILYTINIAAQRYRMFVVYNHAIPDAAGYHHKMGMKNIKDMLQEINLGNVTDDINSIREILKSKSHNIKMNFDDSYLTNGGILANNGNSWKNGYMFYAKKSYINYDDIHSIIYSLSEQSNLFKNPKNPKRRRQNGGSKSQKLQHQTFIKNTKKYNKMKRRHHIRNKPKTCKKTQKLKSILK